MNGATTQQRNAHNPASPASQANASTLPGDGDWWEMIEQEAGERLADHLGLGSTLKDAVDKVSRELGKKYPGYPEEGASQNLSLLPQDLLNLAALGQHDPPGTANAALQALAPAAQELGHTLGSVGESIKENVLDPLADGATQMFDGIGNTLGNAADTLEENPLSLDGLAAAGTLMGVGIGAIALAAA